MAADGYEAIAKAQQKKYDLVFVDVRLPGMDGVETLRRLKEIAPDAVFIMMSGHDVSDEIREAFAAGAQAQPLPGPPRQSPQPPHPARQA